MPRLCALVSLLPASSPATTKAVFLLTEPDAFPPWLLIRSSACFLLRVGSVPVTTILFPENTPSDAAAISRGLTPAANSRSIIWLFSGKLKYSVTLPATVSPMSGIAVSAPSSASFSLSSVPNLCARSLAVFLPTFGIPSAKRNASSSQCLLFSRASVRFAAFFSLKPSSIRKSIGVRLYRSAGCLTPIWSYSWPAVFSLNPSISIASRPAKWASLATAWGLQVSRFMQNRCAPRSTSGLPHAGQIRGFSIVLSFSFLLPALPMISGITSLLLRIHTSQPMATSLRCISPRLFSVAFLTVTP